MRRLGAALVHYPVLARQGHILTTSLVNLDLHDLARAARTYGLEALYIVHPNPSQRLLAERILGHWVGGKGAERIPSRADALGLVRLVESLDQALSDLGGAEAWVTAAREHAASTSYPAARAILDRDGPPVLLCFGTGWGLAPSVIEAAAVRLEPIRGRAADAYNHLSVRSAAAIVLDRLR